MGIFTYCFLDEQYRAEPDQHYDLVGNIKMPGVPSGLGVVLFCKGGQPHNLEIFSYGDEHWDGAFDGFALEQL